MKIEKLSRDLTYIGAIDSDLRTFDVIMRTEYGTTYNAYLLKGTEKSALIETAKASFTDAYLQAIGALTDVASIEYLIISHTEPDHSGSIERLLDLNPGLTIIGTTAGIGFLKEIVNRPFVSRVVKAGDTLSLGDKTLRFFPLPNLHWPDTMFTYIEEEKALVTCDAFGAHYAHEDVMRSRIRHEADYQSAVRYYFDHIIAPFARPFMQNALDAIRNLDIALILTGHGPVLDTKIPEALAQYEKWCEAPARTGKHVVIPFVSAYGYTGQLADAIAQGIAERGDIDVSLHDMVAAAPSVVLDEIAQADGVLLGSPTMLGDALAPICTLTLSMLPPTHGGKLASAFGSYGWSGEAVPNLLARLKQLRLKVEDDGLRVRFKPTDTDMERARQFGRAFAERLR